MPRQRSGILNRDAKNNGVVRSPRKRAEKEMHYRGNVARGIIIFVRQAAATSGRDRPNRRGRNRLAKIYRTQYRYPYITA